MSEKSIADEILKKGCDRHCSIADRLSMAKKNIELAIDDITTAQKLLFPGEVSQQIILNPVVASLKSLIAPMQNAVVIADRSAKADKDAIARIETVERLQKLLQDPVKNTDTILQLKKVLDNF